MSRSLSTTFRDKLGRLSVLYPGLLQTGRLRRTYADGNLIQSQVGRARGTALVADAFQDLCLGDDGGTPPP